jgi:hypothetical protein
MTSTWLDESDLPNYGNTGYPELNEQLIELKKRWLFEYDTVENRKIMKKQFADLVQSYIPKRRNDRINSILE